ncbi:hypothetical protein Q7P37_009938 [Cladosporium fusiforme]
MCVSTLPKIETEQAPSYRQGGLWPPAIPSSHLSSLSSCNKHPPSKREKNRQVTPPVNLEMPAVSRKQHERDASHEHDEMASELPPSTRWHRAHGRKSRKERVVDQQLLTPREEQAIVDFVLRADRNGYPARVKDLRRYAAILLQKRAARNDPGTAVHVDSRTPGKDWPQAFCKRYPELKAKRLKALDWKRHEKNLYVKTVHWFDIMREQLNSPGVSKENVYNMDETGGLIERAWGVSVRRTLITAVECISADSVSLTPLIIFPGSTLRSNWLGRDGRDWHFACSKKGYMNSSINLEWMRKVFDPQTRARANGQPRVLISDGFSPHESADVLTFCFENNISLCRLPSHTSHKLQPCDVSVFGPLKTAYREQVEHLQRRGANTVNKEHFVQLYDNARKAALTDRNIRSGWLKAGLFPLNPSRVLADMPAPIEEPLALPPNPDAPRDAHSYQPLVTPTTAEGVHSIYRMLEERLSANGSLSDPHLVKFLHATEKAFADRSLLLDENQGLRIQNNEKRVRENTAKKVVSQGDAKIMSREDIAAVIREKTAKANNASSKKSAVTKRKPAAKRSSGRGCSITGEMAAGTREIEAAGLAEYCSVFACAASLLARQIAPANNVCRANDMFHHYMHHYEGTVADGNARVHYGNNYNFLPRGSEFHALTMGATTAAISDRPGTPPPPLSTVPFPRDPDYIHREQLVTKIRHKLSVPGARVALVGLGGVGKSQLAIEYAHQVRQESPETWVLWLHASNATRFELSVRDTLEQLKVPGGNDQKANVFQLFRTWLRDANKGKWLLIIDNADDVRFLLEPPSTTGQTGSQSWSQVPSQGERCLDYLPECSQGSLLVTTRSSDAALKMVEQRNIVSVDLMNERHAVSLLKKKLGGGHNRDEIVELARELEHMPLAMAQAAAYIRQRAPRCSVQSYVEKLKKSRKSKLSLLGRDEGDLRRDRDAKNSILSTWQISFEHVWSIRRSAANLLSLMSCFDRQAIPEALLRARNTELDEHATSRAKTDPHIIDDEESDQRDDDSESRDSSDDEIEDTSATEGEDFEEDLVMLRGYSFIAVTKDTATFEMHSLVQLATQRWLQENQRLTHWQAQFVHNLENGFPMGRFENWAKCRSLFPHAMIVLEMRLTDQSIVLQQACLLYKSGWYASEQGAYVYAERMEALCMKLRRKVLGPEHPDTLTSMSNLALTYQYQGQYDKAAELGGRVLEIRKRVLGPEHPDTLTSMANQAFSFTCLDYVVQAIENMRMSARLSNSVLGNTHPDALSRNQVLSQWSNEHAKTIEAGFVDTASEKGSMGSIEDDEGINVHDGGVRISEL